MVTSRARARAVVLVAALVTYANSLGNGFALDDNWFIAENPVVHEARFGEAFTQAAWPGAVEGVGNYRPLALSSFAVEWALWGDATLGFHAMSVLSHALVALLVLALLTGFVSLPAALVGALFFAVHPVHSEAVANVMGRSELYAALAYLGACLVYLDVRHVGPWARGARLLLLMALFLVALGAKEIAVTLPGVLVVLEVYRQGARPLRARLVGEALTYFALIAVLACYVLVRWNVLGDLTGESAAAGLLSLSPYARILTALTVWTHYLRLIVFPFDLVADYGPNVLRTTASVTPGVVLGAMLLIGAVATACALRRRSPTAALGFAWFVVAISPVSNLIVRSDILLAERTLYLPSVGAAFVAAAVAAHVMAIESSSVRRILTTVAFAVGALFMARTVDRNPSWLDTFSVLSTLAIEHPESWVSARTHAISLSGIGDHEGASRAYEAAIEIAPDHYQLLVEAAVFYAEIGRDDHAEELLLQAITLMPQHPEAYRRLGEQRLVRGRGREAHAVALEGLLRSRDDAGLWAVLSESYVAKGDLEAAARARRTALGRDSLSVTGWSRLAELYEAMDRLADAAAARTRAAELDRLTARGD